MPARGTVFERSQLRTAGCAPRDAACDRHDQSAGIDGATDAISLFKTTTMRNIINENVADVFVPRYTAWCGLPVSTVDTEALSRCRRDNAGQRSQWPRSSIRCSTEVGCLPRVENGNEDSGDGMPTAVIESWAHGLLVSVRCPLRLRASGRAGARMGREISDGVAVAKLERDRPCRRCP
jgi:hypothetical protein